MEGLAAAGGVIAVVSLAGQVVQGCSYLCNIFENANAAPNEVRLLTTELTIIERIAKTTPDETTPDERHQDALDFCNEAVTKLRNVVDKYGVLNGVGRSRRWGTRLAMALNGDKIAKHLSRLREAKGYLEHLQNISAHKQSLVKSGEILESVQQLSTSHSEATTIISRTEGKLDEIGGITKQTQLALRELADRFVNRENQAVVQDGWNILRMTSAVETILRDVLTEHLSGLVRMETRPAKSNRLQAQSNYELGVLNAVNAAPAITYSGPVVMQATRRPLSEIDQRLAELSDSAWRNDRIEDEEKPPHMEKTSKYQTRLGEIFVRTTSTTYESADEMVHVALPDSFGSSPNPTHFPVTITKTDILLLPQNWAQKRGATIRCHHVSGPSSTLSDISFRLRDFRRVSKSPCSPILKEFRGTKPSGISNIRTSASSIVQNSPLLLYTAFKTAFVANHIWKSKVDEVGTRLSMGKPIPRNSFDNEINDAIELVHLWLASGLDVEFYKTAFPGDMAKTETQCEGIFRVSSTRSRDFQQLRLEYTYRLVMETVLKFFDKDWNEGRCLTVVHQDYWDRCERMALSSSLAVQFQAPSTTEVLDVIGAVKINQKYFDPHESTYLQYYQIQRYNGVIKKIALDISSFFIKLIDEQMEPFLRLRVLGDKTSGVLLELANITKRDWMDLFLIKDFTECLIIDEVFEASVDIDIRKGQTKITIPGNFTKGLIEMVLKQLRLLDWVIEAAKLGEWNKRHWEMEANSLLSY